MVGILYSTGAVRKDRMTYRKDIKGIHLYSKGLEFPVAGFEKSDWDRTQISYLDTSKHTTRSLITWCKNHHIDWEIVYPIRKSSPFRHPIRHIHYLKLVKSL